MIRQSSAGIYSWLPLGLAVLKKIEGIIRNMHYQFNIHELLMPTIQSAELWKNHKDILTIGRNAENKRQK